MLARHVLQRAVLVAPPDAVRVSADAAAPAPALAAPSDPHDDAALARRLRGGATVLLLGTVVSLLARASAGQASTTYAAVKALQVAMIFAVFVALRGTPTRRRSLVVGVVLVLEMAVTTSVSAWLAGEAQLAFLLMLIFLLGSATIFPWGIAGQGAAVFVTMLAALPLLRLPPPATPSRAPLAAALVMGAVTSLWIAAAGARQRRAEHRAAQADASAMLARFGNRMMRLLDAELIVEHLVGAMREALRCEVTAAVLREPDGGWTPTGAIAGAPPLDDVALSALADRLRAAAVPVVEIADQRRAGAAAWVGLQSGGDLDGMLLAERPRGAGFSAADRGLASGLAHIAALALRNARLVADLERANRVKSDFVSMMSHEMRTPLHIVLGYAEMLDDPATGAVERAGLVRQLALAGRDLLELIESTLEVGRLEAGRATVQIERVEIAALWRRLGAECARYRRRAGVALEWNDDVQSTVVATDQRRLAIVVRNLVGNACKFTEHGAVSAMLALEPEAIVIRVRDSGIGIASEHQPRIWEMFAQVPGDDAQSRGGSGLGLYLVRRFVEQLGGVVEVESTPGVGSTFTVRLPRGFDVTRARAAA